MQNNRYHHSGERSGHPHQNSYRREPPRNTTHQATVQPLHEKKIDPKCLTWTTAKPWFVAKYSKKKDEEAVSIEEKTKTTTIVGSNAVEGEKEKMAKRDELDRYKEKCRAERERKNQENDAWVTEYLRKKKEEAASLAEKTARIMGRSAVDEKQMKGAIRDRLIKKYKAEQEIEKCNYDVNPPKKGSSDEETDDEDIYDGMHPIDYDTKQNLTYLRALAELEIPPVEGKCWCFLSKVNRQWHQKNKVTNHIWGSCNRRCLPFDSRKSLVNHLREGDAMHKYTIEFLEEWWKQE
jgi:hypothetical protein